MADSENPADKIRRAIEAREMGERLQKPLGPCPTCGQKLINSRCWFHRG